jgi:hypothetical protein
VGDAHRRASIAKADTGPTSRIADLVTHIACAPVGAKSASILSPLSRAHRPIIMTSTDLAPIHWPAGNAHPGRLRRTRRSSFLVHRLHHPTANRRPSRPLVHRLHHPTAIRRPSRPLVHRLHHPTAEAVRSRPLVHRLHHPTAEDIRSSPLVHGAHHPTVDDAIGHVSGRVSGRIAR